MQNIHDMTQEAIDRITGPITEDRPVLIDGRMIPNLTITRKGQKFRLSVDNRFGVDLPPDLVVPVAYVLAQALAVGAGYSHSSAESKSQPFAPYVAQAGKGAGDE